MMLAILCAGLLGTIPSTDSPPTADVKQAYAEAKARAGRTPDEQIKLALWCESHGLSTQKLHHLTLAVLADPTNAAARGLLGLVAYNGRWLRPEIVAEKTKADPVLAQYQDKRLKAAYTADAQFALGVWADEHGLKEQAKAHLTAVIRLDPRRDLAWKKLGFKKHDGRWVTDAQLALEKADAEAQKVADRKWKPLLEKYKAMLDQPSKREEAENALANVTDPRAVPTIILAFVKGRESDQSRAVQLLGQIDSASSSKALAYLAVFSDSPEIRRVSIETLKRRDLREFAGLLLALLRDPIKYQIRPVGGPGSPGAIFVEGDRFNVQRLYSPPSARVNLQPGDWVGTDEYGLPVVHRYGSSKEMAYTTPRITADHLLEMISANNLPFMQTSDPAQVTRELNNAGLGKVAPLTTLTQIQNTNIANFEGSLEAEINRVKKTEHKNTSQFGFIISQGRTYSYDYQIPVGQMMIEAQKTALLAQEQLTRDVAMLDAQNKVLCRQNDRVLSVLNAIAGKNVGQDTKSWKAWWVDQLGYASMTSTDSTKPTYFQDVPLDYQPQQPPISVQVTSSAQWTGFSRMSCFGAGTPIRTVDGVRPIESLQVGDLVLSQSIGTGALGYRPILVVHHNPPSPTFRIKLGGESIISSHFHRFWVAGRGWVMARDLKAGDPVRTLGGVLPVEAVEADKVQPVYNLDIADDADFFAGQLGALVHDNTLPDPRLVPFDGSTKAEPVAVVPKPGQ